MASSSGKTIIETASADTFAERRPDGRSSLLQVAIDLFAARGFAGTSIRDIASAAGCSVSNVYHHFQNKESLWLAVLENSIDDLPALLLKALDAPGDTQRPLERFERLVRTHVATSHKFPRESQILFIDEGHLSPESDAARLRLQHAILKIYVDELKALVRAGVARDEQIRIKALNVLGVINWHLRWMKSGAPANIRAAEADAIVTFVLRAVDERSAAA